MSHSARRLCCIPTILKLICSALAVAAGAVHSQTAAPRAPAFVVASIKPCRADVPLGARTGGGVSSPALLDINCQTVKGLIQMAYVTFAPGRRVTPLNVTIEGGPAWINSERFDIKAKAESIETPMMIRGPMLQRLLEDRFRLRIHRETRDIPVYALIVDKGGSKLHPFAEGSCNPYDPGASFPPPPVPENPCLTKGGMKAGVMTIDVQAATVDDIARFYLGDSGRPIINKTGILGRFDFHLEYVPDETSPPLARAPNGFPAGAEPAEPSGPSIFSAVQQQLGLKLQPAKGPGEYLVIDAVERPSEN